MGYKLFDISGNEVHYKNLQNRSAWYVQGEEKEVVFVEEFHNVLDVKINPDKLRNPSLPDLLCNGDYSELKCQNTPFFQAERYKVDPQYAVTFNLTDALMYGEFGFDYKSMIIFFWIDWIVTSMITPKRRYQVRPMSGVWKTTIKKINVLREKSHIHWYNQRNKFLEKDKKLSNTLIKFEPRLKCRNGVFSLRGINNNSACSYVFDLRDFEKVF